MIGREEQVRKGSARGGAAPRERLLRTGFGEHVGPVRVQPDRCRVAEDHVVAAGVEVPQPPWLSGRIVEHDLCALASVAVLVTSMLAAGSMRGERSAIAVIAATSQLRVQRVDHLSIESGDATRGGLTRIAVCLDI